MALRRSPHAVGQARPMPRKADGLYGGRHGVRSTNKPEGGGPWRVEAKGPWGLWRVLNLFTAAKAQRAAAQQRAGAVWRGWVPRAAAWKWVEWSDAARQPASMPSAAASLQVRPSSHRPDRWAGWAWRGRMLARFRGFRRLAERSSKAGWRLAPASQL
jgi:hypothetical protein